MIKKATYTSVWDGGCHITSDCKVNTETKEVFDIEGLGIDWVEVLEEEYITIDGEDYSVSRDGEGDTEFWYS